MLRTFTVARSRAHGLCMLWPQDIIINSLYSKKEIFLRELISNGSDVRRSSTSNTLPLRPCPCIRQWRPVSDATRCGAHCSRGLD